MTTKAKERKMNEEELKEEEFRKVLVSIRKGKATISFDMDGLTKYVRSIKEERNAEVKQAIEEWYNDEKTCSGKPHCLIEECDLCVECFDELLQKLGLDTKEDKEVKEK